VPDNNALKLTAPSLYHGPAVGRRSLARCSTDEQDDRPPPAATELTTNSWATESPVQRSAATERRLQITEQQPAGLASRRERGKEPTGLAGQRINGAVEQRAEADGASRSPRRPTEHGRAPACAFAHRRRRLARCYPYFRLLRKYAWSWSDVGRGSGVFRGATLPAGRIRVSSEPGVSRRLQWQQGLRRPRS